MIVDGNKDGLAYALRERVSVVVWHLWLISLLMLAQTAWCAEDEYDIKSAFIFKLTHFIHWPVDIGEDIEKFNFCVIGDHSFNSRLDDLAKISSINAKPIVLKYLDDKLDFTGCHILFIAEAKISRLKKILDEAYLPSPTLTMSDRPGFAKQGVMINFYVDSGRVGFEINLENAKSQGFEISSRVLKLARIIND